MNKVVPYVDNSQEGEAPSREGTIKALFVSMTTYLQLLGVYVPKERKGFVRKLQWFYNGSLVMVLWANMARMIFALQRERGDLAHMMGSVSMVITGLSGTYLHAASLYAYSNHFDVLLDMFVGYHQRYGQAYNEIRLEKMLRSINIVITFIAIGAAGGGCYNIAATQGSFSQWMMTPYENPSSNMHIPFAVFLGVLFAIFIECWMINFAHFCVISYCLGKEFDAIVNGVEDTTAQKGVDGTFELLRIRHTELCTLVRQGNKIITHFFFTTFSSGLPVTCLFLYGLVHGSPPSGDLLISAGTMFWCLAVILSSTIVAALLNIEAHASLESIMHADFTDTPDHTLHIVSIFVSRLNGPPIGFNVYGLFTIDTSMLLTLVGTLFAYTTVVLQLKPEY